jgi:hypothetical protein
MVQEMLRNQYNLMVISQEHLENSILNSKDYFKVHCQDDITMFILFIKYGANISVINRVGMPELLDENIFLSRL